MAQPRGLAWIHRWGWVVGLTDAQLYDRHGVVGRLIKSLLMDVRQGGTFGEVLIEENILGVAYELVTSEPAQSGLRAVSGAGEGGLGG